MLDINQLPGYAIRRLHQISVGIFLQEVGALGVTPVQYAALQTVSNEPGLDQRTLARQIALDTSTTGGVVDRLELRGWMERRMAPFAEVLGWRPVFDHSRVMVCDDLKLIERKSLRPFGIFTMMRFEKVANESRIAAE